MFVSSKFIVQFNAAVKTGRCTNSEYHVHISSWQSHRSVNKSPGVHLFDDDAYYVEKIQDEGFAGLSLYEAAAAGLATLHPYHDHHQSRKKGV